MERRNDVQYESFNNYPWLDYKKHEGAWLPVMGAGSNGEQYCVITHTDNGVSRAMVTRDIYDMILSHEGMPLEIRYTSEQEGQVGVEIKEIGQEGEG
jgi:hypothetical protein